MHFLARINILSKLLAVIGMIGIVVGGCVWYAQAQMTKIDDAYSVFIVREARAVATARRLNRMVFELNYSLYRTIAETERPRMEKASAAFADALPQIRKALAELREQAPSFAERTDRQAALIEDFTKVAQEALRIALLPGQHGAEALDLTHARIDPIFETLVAGTRDLGTEIQRYMEKGSDDLTDQTNATRHSLIGFSALGLFLGTLAAILVAVFGITRPMGNLVSVLRRMAEGDTDAEITEATRGDEIGAIGRAVAGIRAMVAQKAAEQAEIRRIADEAAASERRRAMMELANRFETTVGGIVGLVSSAATELQATAQTMTATATETASQSNTVAAAAEEAASNVGTVAAAAEELGSSVQEIGRQVSGSADLAQVAVGEADQTAQLVHELSQAAARIGDVVSLISTIAGQTNLLALNATIEAARAGEAGRGFAVVAAEVKELASQTARATEEISGQIAQIQGVTDQAVDAIGGIATRIREISQVATSIAAAVEEQGAATQEIVRNVAQAATGTGEVTHNITGVAGAAEETGAAASQVLSSASELSRQSEHLNAEVAHFLASVRAA
ncbi:methyl-accepting chemotaxis protein [Methylobacterium organophilum]|uniref:methyl-accepting chemotaxis protein n=1 Tax=Methylobacterium organophilum TaxID=410 RepID=UPI001F146A03|nr:HAMP domain-containing methyl-accepting chemotaxis protein [Methylobacterium organophilum]UMY16619.1 methyl-accepting chemotaxis protein [Methylobacterium organophilum]